MVEQQLDSLGCKRKGKRSMRLRRIYCFQHESRYSSCGKRLFKRKDPDVNSGSFETLRSLRRSLSCDNGRSVKRRQLKESFLDTSQRSERPFYSRTNKTEEREAPMSIRVCDRVTPPLLSLLKATETKRNNNNNKSKLRNPSSNYADVNSSLSHYTLTIHRL
ncbi:uncharacterized protein V6R79_011069 [Siganus canaliculatus]